MVRRAALQESHIKKYSFCKELTQFQQLRDTVVIFSPARSQGDSDDRHDLKHVNAKFKYAANHKM